MTQPAKKSKPKTAAASTSASKPATKKASRTKGAKAAAPAKRPAAKASSTAAAERAIGNNASALIDQRIRELQDWRGETLARMRALILETDPEMIEEWKWMGTPVWSHAGNVCTGESYQKVVKLTFARGAALDDPAGLFNSSLDGNTRRAIDIREGAAVDEDAFKTLILAAVAENLRHNAPKAKESSKSGKAQQAEAKSKPSTTKSKSQPKLLSGGNPQVAKADGDAPVQQYIAGMPGWKRDVGRRIDELVVQTVPHVRKAVKWNSPFYGVEGQGWFLSFHVFTHYVKVTFFVGKLLRPNPPGSTERTKDARWIDIREDDQLDEVQLAKWIKQAAALPGWNP